MTHYWNFSDIDDAKKLVRKIAKLAKRGTPITHEEIGAIARQAVWIVDSVESHNPAAEIKLPI